MWESIVGFFFYWIMKDYLNNVYFYIIIYLKYVLYYKSYVYIDWVFLIYIFYKWLLFKFIYLFVIYEYEYLNCVGIVYVLFMILNWNL